MEVLSAKRAEMDWNMDRRREKRQLTCNLDHSSSTLRSLHCVRSRCPRVTLAPVLPIDTTKRQPLHILLAHFNRRQERPRTCFRFHHFLVRLVVGVDPLWGAFEADLCCCCGLTCHCYGFAAHDVILGLWLPDEHWRIADCTGVVWNNEPIAKVNNHYIHGYTYSLFDFVSLIETT